MQTKITLILNFLLLFNGKFTFLFNVKLLWKSFFVSFGRVIAARVGEAFGEKSWQELCTSGEQKTCLFHR